MCTSTILFDVFVKWIFKLKSWAWYSCLHISIPSFILLILYLFSLCKPHKKTVFLPSHFLFLYNLIILFLKIHMETKIYFNTIGQCDTTYSSWYVRLRELQVWGLPNLNIEFKMWRGCIERTYIKQSNHKKGSCILRYLGDWEK